MRTMYIILSWAGWAWAAVALPAVAIAVHRRARSDHRAFPTEPKCPEAEQSS